MTKTMIAVALSLTSLVALPSASSAADLPQTVYKTAPQPAILPPYSWTGFYFGANLGGKSARFDEVVTAAPAFPLGALALASDSATSAMGGAQIGYMWQNQHWVFGAEGDIEGTGLRRTALASGAVPAPFVAGDSLTIRNNWQASLRARLGWAWDCVLLYATGGAAWANLKADANFVPVGVLPALNVSTDRTLFGWTIGGGLDYGITAALSLGAEYRYTRYDGERNLALSPLPIGVGVTTPLSLSTGLQTHEITARLSYHFGAGAAGAYRY
jgi:outer membrane immunogenic protein